MSSKTIEERIDILGAKISIRSPFLATVYATLPKYIVDGDYGTASTNGEWIKYNRRWVATLDEEELLYIGLHEACHVALGHIWRDSGEYDPGLANHCQDAVINVNLNKMGFKMPAGGVLIDWVTPDMSWEEVYAKHRKRHPPRNGGGSGGGTWKGDGKPNPMGLVPRPDTGQPQGGFDGTGDCDPCPSPARRAHIEAAITAAARMARECGDGSVLIDRVLGQLHQAKVPWITECRDMVTNAARNDYTFRRFARRFIGSGLYLPALYTEELGGLAIPFDMSGSISQADANSIASELQGLFDDCRPDWVEVCYFDTKVCNVQRFERGDQLALKPRGGGGTAFRAPMEHFARVAEKEPICGMIFFTDMASNDLMQLQEPQYPVIWANIAGGDSDHKVPFGRLVNVNL